MHDIRTIPLTTPAPEPDGEIVPLDEAAKRLSISTDTLRRWIKADLVDGKGRVPGARGEGSAYRIVRAVFEQAMRYGREPERLPTIANPDLAGYIAHLRQRAADDLAFADQLSAALHDTRKAS